MDSFLDIIFDAVDLMVDLRKETKNWAVALLRGAEAVEALFGKVKTTVTTVEKQAKRTVSAFDKLNRLDKKEVSVTTTVTKEHGVLQILEEKLAGVIATIKAALTDFSGTVAEKLQQFGSWDSGGVLQSLSAILTGVGAVQALLKGDPSMALWLGLISSGVVAASNKVGSLVGILTNVVSAFSGVGSASSRVWSAISALWGGASLWFSSKLFTPLGKGSKGFLNVIIGLLNGVMAAGVAAFNTLGKIMNTFSIKIPSWIPLLGGKSFGFTFPSLTAPKIPYLAQGAVLPANKPFLAMVGDQKHGTNIEAPLATIQEAVSLVLSDQVSAITAGFAATVGVQKEILEAVLGISIGDEVIAKANDRYRQKMAISRGGVL